MLDLAAIKGRAALRLATMPAPTMQAAELANPAKWLPVSGAPTPVSQLATLASNDEARQHSDAWCWPHSDAMNTAELARMAARLRQFSRRGIDEAQAERLADRLVKLDREESGLRICAECFRLSGADGQGWRCNDHRAAGVARDLPAGLATTPQRCPAFKESTL